MFATREGDRSERCTDGGPSVRPLQDVRILAVEQYAAGPFGSMHLADLGADVIKIEDPRVGGDVGRYVPPFAEGEDSLFFETFNRGKRSLSLDLSVPAGRQVFDDLVRVSDAVYSNLRGDVPTKIGITYDDLKHLNPTIVCCALTGFGSNGPRQREPGYDYMVQGLAGWMELTGEPEGPPSKSGLSLVDYSGGLVAGLALVAGVHAARRDGVGMDCDVSLFDTGIGMLTYPAVWYLNGGFLPARTRHSAHPSLVPFQAFEAADGWLIIGCAKEKFWRRLADVVGHPEWAEDPRFMTFEDRRRTAGVLIPLLEAVIRTRTVAEWLSPLSDAGVPSGSIHDVPQALVDPQTAARGLIVETEHPRFGTVRQLASPVRVGKSPTLYRRAPRRHENADELLRGLLGYDDVTVTELTAAGAFGRQA